jgi:HSP20 family protein
MIERYDPFGRATSLRQMMDRLLEDAFVMPRGSRGDSWGGQSGGPSLDIYEEGDNLIVEAQLPGIKPEDVDVTVEQGVLTISGKMEREEERKERNYLIRERQTGRFNRALRLPASYNPDACKADFDNGVLRLTFPKAEEARPRRIQISGGGQRVVEGQRREATSGHAGGSMAPSGATGKPQVREGMQVAGSDGEEIGRVKEVRNSDFLLDRRMHRDVYVPFDAIDRVDGERVTLTVSASRIDQMGWQQPGTTAAEPGARSSTSR